MPYVDFLPAEINEYAVFIKRENITDQGISVIELLEKVPEAEVTAKRRVIARLLPRLVYRNVKRTLHAVDPTNVEGDDEHRRELLGWESAYEVAIEAALQKMRDRTRQKDENVEPG